jgi:galactokinase/mevalonate kinase-like predicted kinase
MTTLQDVIDDTEMAMDELVKAAEQVKPEQLGLDRRAGYHMYVVEGNHLIVRLGSGDRQLQYYGGFEYVDKDHRSEVGGYAVYSAESDRVQEAIATHAGDPFACR